MMTATIERFEDLGHDLVDIVPATTDNVAKAVLDHVNAYSADLTLNRDARRLHVSMSEGRIAILLVEGEDNFYDLVGDARATGRTRFVHGGQPAEHPLRHCVGLESTLQVVKQFIDGTDVLTTWDWEKQGAVEHA